MRCGLGTGPVVPLGLALARGLWIVVIATALAVVALFADARLRSREHAVLLPVPHKPATPASPAAAPADDLGKPQVETGPSSASSDAKRAGPSAEPEPSAPLLPARPITDAAPSPAPAAEHAGGAAPAAPSPRVTVRDGVLAYQAGDYARAYVIWRQLAEAGNARARFHLGALYLEGRLGPPDYVAAYRWLALAAEAGQRAAVPLRDQAAKALSPNQVATIRRALGLPPDP